MQALHRIAAAILALWASMSIGSAVTIGQLGILDSSANGGINPATGLPWASGDTYRLAFVTSIGIDATSADISTYNLHVQSLAEAAGLGSGWKAIVSTPTIAARDNTGTNPANGPGTSIFLTDGLSLFAENHIAMWARDIRNPIALDEFGSPVSRNASVFTGSTNSGLANDALGGGRRVTVGRVDNPNQWIDNRSLSATDSLRIYALSDVLMVTANPSGPIPEPSTLLLSALGASMMLARRRRD